jgi:hypothetical protein
MSAVCSSNVAALLLLLLAIGALTVDAGSTGSSNSTQVCMHILFLLHVPYVHQQTADLAMNIA